MTSAAGWEKVAMYTPHGDCRPASTVPRAGSHCQSGCVTSRLIGALLSLWETGTFLLPCHPRLQKPLASPPLPGPSLGKIFTSAHPIPHYVTHQCTHQPFPELSLGHPQPQCGYPESTQHSSRGTPENTIGSHRYAISLGTKMIAVCN